MNDMRMICDKNSCTGCGACIDVCPKACIAYEENELDNIYPLIDMKSCIQCGQCRLVCPQLNPVSKNHIRKCYASWSMDTTIRETSASGGVASELYIYLIKCGYKVIGTAWSQHQVVFKITDEIKEVSEFRNSKYVFSIMGECYKHIVDLLKNEEKVFFVGLPCQIAGIKNFCKLKNVDTQNLILVDLVCHGVVASKYLLSHIKHIESRKKRKAKRIFFRNPQFHTWMFNFTLEDNEGIFYRKRVKSNDCYQLAYHKALAYRENCYNCQYACRERSGDLSLCDFTSVGAVKEFAYTNRNVSCVMINTVKGEKLWEEILISKRIWAEERPIEEITDYENQLNAPSKKHRNRNKFEEAYVKRQDFTKAAHYALQIDIIWNLLNYVLPLRKMNDFMKTVIHHIGDIS